MQKWDVKQLMGGAGYQLLLFFNRDFCISMQDMQLLLDVCPLRIDSVLVRKPYQEETSAAAVLCISLLSQDQPVTLTEADVIRVRKRSRGLLNMQ